MHILFRIIQRIIVGIVVLGTAWFLITQVWNRLDQQLHIFLAIFFTYIISAYIILPRIIHVTIFAIRGARIPKFARASDGLIADPVNIILIGSKESLKQAFLKAGWYIADERNIRTSIKIALASIFNRSYENAPFSPLYLFGKKQDIGFEQAINFKGEVSLSASPRRRHHIRFWAINIEDTNIENWHHDQSDASDEPEFQDFYFWKNKHVVDYNKPILWVGAGTKDIGFGLEHLTYKISHTVDRNVDEERDYILNSLEKVDALAKKEEFLSGQWKIGRFTSDGKITIAKLK